jgi:Mg2+/Co2+ transporter CorB
MIAAIWIMALLILVLLIVSAVFSAAETALTGRAGGGCTRWTAKAIQARGGSTGCSPTRSR